MIETFFLLCFLDMFVIEEDHNYVECMTSQNHTYLQK